MRSRDHRCAARTAPNRQVHVSHASRPSAKPAGKTARVRLLRKRLRPLRVRHLRRGTGVLRGGAGGLARAQSGPRPGRGKAAARLTSLRCGAREPIIPGQDRKSVGLGTREYVSVTLGGRRILKKTKNKHKNE